MSRSIDIRRITLIALMAGLIFVLTTLPRIPTPIGGYVHLGDVGVTFAALAFGPWVALVAGGLGTALADIYGGYAQFALASLLVHGLQGWALATIVRRRKDVLSLGLAVAVGTLIVVAGYFVAEVLMYGAADAALELVPNALQVLTGGVIGVPLYMAVKKAYPPLSRYAA